MMSERYFRSIFQRKTADSPKNGKRMKLDFESGLPTSSSTSMEHHMFDSMSTGSENSGDELADQHCSKDSSYLMKHDDSSYILDRFSTLMSDEILESYENEKSTLSTNNVLRSSKNSMTKNETPVNTLRSTATKLGIPLIGNKEGSKRQTEQGEVSVSILKRLKRNEGSNHLLDEKLSKNTNLSTQRRSLPLSGLERTIVRKSSSVIETDIDNALQRANSNPNLIGDFSKPFALPLIVGKHPDLKSISGETLAKLINGQYDKFIEFYAIVDCRYPYEYEGGHIKGALNVYTKDQVSEIFVENPDVANRSYCQTASEYFENRRRILIFYCEFSSERGPTLSRFLRSLDRNKNSLQYPKLDYPEMYLLDGGYCSFYEDYKGLCEPVSYTSMLNPMYAEEFRFFRSQSTLLYGAKKARSRITSQSSSKRLNL